MLLDGQERVSYLARLELGSGPHLFLPLLLFHFSLLLQLLLFFLLFELLLDGSEGVPDLLRLERRLYPQLMQRPVLLFLGLLLLALEELRDVPLYLVGCVILLHALEWRGQLVV